MSRFSRRMFPCLGVVLWLAMVWCGAVRAGDAGPFGQGNAFYAAGNYAEAARAYEDDVRLGHDSANLFYNLGDAYYRLGDKGRATLNYRRALLLEPTHAEAAANLAFVTGGKPGANTRNADAVWDGVARAAAVFGWFGAAALLLALASRRHRALGVGLAVGGFLICAVGAGLVWDFDAGSGNASRAVVIAEAAPARYSPDDGSKVVTRLPAGGEIRILSEQGAWMYVQLAGGTTRAWMASKTVAPLVPR